MKNLDPKFKTKTQPNCPVCFSKKRSLKYSNAIDINHGTVPGEWSFWQCSNCTSLYLDPRLCDDDLVNAYSEYETHSNPVSLETRKEFVGLWQAIKLGYLWLRYNYSPGKQYKLAGWLMYLTPPYIRAEWDSYMMHIPKYKSGGRILDIGCGSGGFLLRAKACGWDVTGVDFDKKSVQIAKVNGLKVFHGAIDALDDSEKFDVITMSHVIEHVTDPNDLLNKAWSKLNNNGVLCLLTPNNEGFGIIKWGNNWATLDTPRHLVLYNTCSITIMLKQIKLKNLQYMPRGWHHRHVEMNSIKSNNQIALNETIMDKLIWHFKEANSFISKRNADEIFVRINKTT